MTDLMIATAITVVLILAVALAVLLWIFDDPDSNGGM